MSERDPDIIYGAANIADHIFSDRKKTRRIYYLSSSSNLPVFRLGARICMRKSALNNWIASQEGKNGTKPKSGRGT
jgi:hypothetical protein